MTEPVTKAADDAAVDNDEFDIEGDDEQPESRAPKDIIIDALFHGLGEFLQAMGDSIKRMRR